VKSQRRLEMSNGIIKIKIDVKAFIAALPRPEDEEGLYGAKIVSVYLADILNEAGIEAEAQYEDHVWCVDVKGQKCYGQYIEPSDPEETFLSSIQNFTDELNRDSDYEAWYSYSNKMHYLNLKEKEPLESLNDLFN
jgi:hypothetical protein